MWLQNLKELKKRVGLSSKQIAEKENLPERTVSRIFSGDTDNPGVDTIRRIIHALGGSWAEIFAETGAVIGDKDLATMKAEVEKLNAEITMLKAENAVLKDKVSSLTSENDLLRLKLEYEEKIASLHNYYMKIKSNE